MLEVKNVSKHYVIKKRSKIFSSSKIKKNAVKNVSINIPKGKIIGVLGENGAGKTTLIKMMTTLLLPDSGEILLDGNDINDDLALTRKKINVINGGERNLYWRLTAIENLVYFASLYNISRDDALSISEPLLIEFGLLESRDIPVEQYSKGMKQRLQIIKGLLNNPSYLFLDEPTIGLDVSVSRDLRERIKDIANNKNKGVLLTTHYMAEAEELCDYIYILNKGRIILEGTKDEVLQKLSLDKEVIINLIETGTDDRSILNLNNIFPESEITDVDGECVFRLKLKDREVTEVLSTLTSHGYKFNKLQVIEPSLEDAIIKLKKENKDD